MTLRFAILAAAAALLTSCGGDDEAAEPAAPSATPAPAGDTSERFPERPQLTDDFSDPGSGWPRASYREGALAVDGVAVAPRTIRPPTRGTLAEVVLDPPAGGEAGLLCRATADASTGYALLLARDGAVQVVRFEDGRATVLERLRLAPNERAEHGRPSLLRLACGTAEPGTALTLAFTVNASPYGYVTDERAVDPGAAAHVGLVSRGGVAVFDDFALSLAM